MASFATGDALRASARRFFGSPLRATSTIVAALVLAAAVVAVPISTAAAHAAAVDRYEAAGVRLDRLTDQLAAAQSRFASASDALVSLSGTVATLRSSPAGVLPATHHTVLDAVAGDIEKALAQRSGEAPGEQEATASADSTTEELTEAAVTVERQTRREAGWLDATRVAIDSAEEQRDATNVLLAQLVTGAKHSDDRPAIDPLETAGTALLAAFPRADAASRAALTTAAGEARTAANAGATVEAELLAFVARAHDLATSQEAADRAAAEAAARAAAEEAAREAAQSRSESSGSSGESGSGRRPTVWPPPPEFPIMTHPPKLDLSGP
ncbi:hypothetical protein [Leifsonia sp. Le1]|uniref:hypothetical protein n=1 Tax=Leifsonia sp. Le1 TaxID=3404918 RepID=UPI003EB8882E